MRYVWDSQPDKALIRPSLSDPTYSTYLPYNVNEFAERRKFYTEYVPFWASFGICIQEYVRSTSGILRIRAEYSPLGGLLEYVDYVFTYSRVTAHCP